LFFQPIVQNPSQGSERKKIEKKKKIEKSGGRFFALTPKEKKIEIFFD